MKTVRIIRLLKVLSPVLVILFLIAIVSSIHDPAIRRLRIARLPFHPDQAREHLEHDLAHWPLIQRRIPRIIHQIYSSEMVPDIYVPYIQSWVNNHPDYEYWLWDDASSRLLVEKYYPRYLELFDAYCHDLFRSDATRYFLLHKFGGMYMDMDYMNYKNMEPLLEGRQCLLVQENEKQAWVLYNLRRMVMNAWMASVPAHPFMNFTINSLPAHASCKFGDVLKSTGPVLLYHSRIAYLQESECCGRRECGVDILSSELMMPRWDASNDFRKDHCTPLKFKTKYNMMQRRACDQIWKMAGPHGLPNITSDVYASHEFLHFGNLAKKLKMDKVNITSILPRVVNPRLDGKL